MKYQISVLLLMLSLLASPGLSYSERLVCPDKIDVQQNVSRTLEGWTAMSDGLPCMLKEVSFFDGNPEKRVVLIPNKSTKKKGYIYSTWYFDAETAKNLWMRCSYAATTMTYARPINKIYSQCTIIGDLGATIDGQPVLVSIDCI